MNTSIHSLPEGEYLTKRELAALFSVSLRTIDNLIARRTLPFIRISGRLIRFPRAAVEAHLRDHLTIRAREV